MRIRIEEIDDLGSYEVELEERLVPDQTSGQSDSGWLVTWRGGGPTDSGWLFRRQGAQGPPRWFVSDQSGLVYDVADEVAGRALDPVPSARTEEAEGREDGATTDAT